MISRDAKDSRRTRTERRINMKLVTVALLMTCAITLACRHNLAAGTTAAQLVGVDRGDGCPTGLRQSRRPRTIWLSTRLVRS